MVSRKKPKFTLGELVIIADYDHIVGVITEILHTRGVRRYKIFCQNSGADRVVQETLIRKIIE